MKKIIILTLVCLIFSISTYAQEANRNFTISSSLVDTNLTLRRKILSNGNIRFNFRLNVTHLSSDTTCVHFLEIIPVTLRGALLREVTAKRVSTTTKDTLVRWSGRVEPTKRTKLLRSEIHARVSSTCTQGLNAELETSNVASKYSCSNELEGSSPRRQARQLRRVLRVRNR